MTIEHMHPSGAIMITDIIDDHLVTRRYFGYEVDEAVELFEEKFPSVDTSIISLIGTTRQAKYLGEG